MVKAIRFSFMVKKTPQKTKKGIEIIPVGRAVFGGSITSSEFCLWLLALRLLLGFSRRQILSHGGSTLTPSSCTPKWPLMLMSTEMVHSLHSSKGMWLAELGQTFPREEIWSTPWLAAREESQGAEGKGHKRLTVHDTLFSGEFFQINHPSLKSSPSFLILVCDR